jgi:predicted MFS family arabinose efflux permease
VRAFLARPGAGPLLASSLLARLPLGMCSLAILLLVHQQTGSFADAGLAVGAFTVAGAVVAPLQGTLVDRHGGVRVLIPLTVSQGAVLVAFVLIARAHPAAAVIAALAALAGALVPPVDGFVRVLWPVVAPGPAELEAAYQLDATSQEVIWTAGPLLVAALVGWASPSAAVLASAAVGVIGTMLFVSVPLARRGVARTGAERPGKALLSRGLRVVLATSVLVGFGIGAVEVGLPALAVHTGHGSASGVLLALWSVGSMAAGALYGMRAWRSPIADRFAALLAALALTSAPLIAARSLAAAIPLSALAGVGYAPMLSCQYLLVGKLAPAGAAAEAFMWSTASLIAGLAAGSALSGNLVQRVGVNSSFAVSCAVTALAATVALAGSSRLRA